MYNKDDEDIIWKQIPFEPKYEVSNTGRVRNIKTKYVLSLKEENTGYIRSTLSGKSYLNHRLVMLTFDPENEKDVVNHKDEDKKNNNLSNLQWMSHGENTTYSIKKNNRFGEMSPNPKLTNEIVYKIKYIDELNHTETAKLYGINKETVRNIRNGISWKHI